MIIICAYCKKEVDKRPGHVNRAKRIGAPLYCDVVCAGHGRRKPPKTTEQKKAEKAVYDANYREVNASKLKVSKAKYYQARRLKPGFLEKEKQRRKENMHRHVEYCQKPEYKAYKQGYDRKYRAQKDHGDFWESALLVLDIRRECLSKMSKVDIMLTKGTYGKSQKRKRAYERLNSGKPEIGPLGNLKRGQKR